MTYVTGDTIRRLREAKGLTQRGLADQLMVSDKTVSKWETGRGLPDISVLEELSAALGVSVPELLSGEVAVNANVSANLRRGRFYVCPICGNVVYAVGEGAFSCCGVRLPPLEDELQDDGHEATAQMIDGDLFVQVGHPMGKRHHVSFVAYVTDDVLQLRKLYPEQACEARFRKCGHGRIYWFCNRHGLFSMPV